MGVFRIAAAVCSVAVASACVVSSAGGATTASRAADYIVVLKPGADSARVAAGFSARYGSQRGFTYRHVFSGFSASIPAAAVAAVAADPAVAFVTRDREFSFSASPNVECGPSTPTSVQCLPDGVNRIDADLSSTRAGDGRGAVDFNVAVVDTGVDVDHSDLNVAGGADCSDGKKGVVVGSGFDDRLGHGTMVAGVVAARDNDRGVVGVAPGARIWAVGVANKKGSPTLSNMICGVDWVTSTRTDADPGNDIAVANMSIEGPGQDDANCGRTNKDALHVAICASAAAGVTWAVAAGNDNADYAANVPAAYKEVLAVTAMADLDGTPGGRADLNCWGTDLGQKGVRDDASAPFSNYSTLATDIGHTIAAPGVCIDTTVDLEACGRAPGDPRDCYTVGDGTSFASPYVAGVAAVCIATHQCTGTPAQIIGKLVADAVAYSQRNATYGFDGDPLRPIGGKYYGYLIRAALY